CRMTSAGCRRSTEQHFLTASAGPHARCSPPPCGEGLGLGVGVGGGGRCCGARRVPHNDPTPLASLATLPTRGRVEPSSPLGLISLQVNMLTCRGCCCAARSRSARR